MKLLFPQFFQKSKNEKNDIEEMVMEAQQGNEEIRNELLKQYQPFIKKIVSQVSKKYIDDSMDEFSVGLLAFNQAIDQYKEEEKSSFLTFASVVIKRRVIDYIRKETRSNDRVVVHLDSVNGEDDDYDEHYVQQKSSVESYSKEMERQERVSDIQEYQRLLLEFDITFEVLSEKSPKHYDARENAKLIARMVADDEEMSEELMTKKRLPIQKIEPLVSSSRKTIERNRKYIIAIALIYIGNFSSLKSYITPETRGD